MPPLRDHAAIRSILSADPVWSVYALGDMAPGFFEHCSWHAPAGGEPAIVMLYAAFGTPVLFAAGRPEAIAPLFAEIDAPRVYLHVRPEALPAVRTRFRVVEPKEMLRMSLDPARYRPAPPAGAVRLGPRDLDALRRLYRDGEARGEAPDFFFPSMLGQGVFHGIREGGELATAAGTHLVAPEEGVAAIGNVYTRRDRRGRGMGAAATRAVVDDVLRLGIGTVALNVASGNAAAVRLYERLGFVRHGTFLEGIATR